MITRYTLWYLQSCGVWMLRLMLTARSKTLSFAALAVLGGTLPSRHVGCDPVPSCVGRLSFSLLLALSPEMCSAR